MKPYIVRPATIDDAHKIAPLLREKDLREIKAASGRTPEASLLGAFDGSGEVVIADTEDGPVLIGGVRPTSPNVGAIWMMATPLLEHYALPSVRTAGHWISRWHQTYPLLWNRAWEENDLHVRWLSLLGFTFISRVTVRGHPFLEFARHHIV